MTEVLPDPDEPEDGAPAKKGKKPTGPKPRTGSLLRSMDLETVTLDDALRLLSLPRTVGADPANGGRSPRRTGATAHISARHRLRSLANEEQMFTVTLDEALKIYAEPKRRGGQGAATPRCANSAAIPSRVSRW